MATSTGKGRAGFPFWEQVSADNTTPPADPHATSLTCVLAGVAPRFVSEDESFAIWNAEDESSARMVTIKGPLARCGPGEMLACEGKWEKHAKYGWSFKVTDYKSALPQSAQGIATWLEMRVPGIGPTFAAAIVKHFGAEHVFRALDENPQRLYEVRTAKGRAINSSQVEKAIEAWEDVKAIRQIETFLFSQGITANLADKLYRRYGTNVIEILQNDPYSITEMHGVGFKIADKIARNMGIRLDDTKRLQAGILYLLGEAENAGHTFLLLEQIYELSAEILFELDARKGEALEITQRKKVIEAATELAKDRKLVAEDDDQTGQRIYARWMWVQEVRLAENIRELLQNPRGSLFPAPQRPTAPQDATPDEIAALKLPSDEQWSVVELARTKRLCLLTGGPGTGKTASQVTLVRIAEEAGKTVRLAAPTGKAARRMTELTGRQATTIHRLLEYSPVDGGFQRDETNPLEGDLLVVDESSMMSLDVADALFRAIGPNMHVLLVGDIDQLPPVGAGKVFADLIGLEGVVPKVRLTKIFRQAAKSMIIQACVRINTGKLPFLSHDEAEQTLGVKGMDRDFFFIPRADHDATRNFVIDLVCDRLPRKSGLDPRADIMVLAPQRKGLVGIDIINKQLEERLNTNPDGSKPQMVLPERHIRVGSRIIQNKNDYTEGREIMNGEIAIVKAYNDEEKEALLVLDDGDREVWVPTASLQHFTLGWCLSVHKSQGSQFKCVVFPVSTAAYTMLSRSLIYTAASRAESLCIMVGEKRALQMGVGKVDMKRRNSLLGPRITSPQISGKLF